MNEDRYKRLKASAQRYTAHRERAPKEVADKLAEWDAKPAYIERILKELIEDNFIDEERFACAFCHDKFLMYKWGKRKIALELGRYKVSPSALEQGLAYINLEEYLSTLNRLAFQKWERLKEPDPYRKKQKAVTFLMQKGYESDLIWDAVNKLSV